MNYFSRAVPLAAVMLTLMLAACGFHLRGQNNFALPFSSLYVKSANDYAPLIIELKNALQSSEVHISATPAEAQLTLQIVSEASEKQILSLSSAGRVLQYRLHYRVMLRVYDQKQLEWLSPQEIRLRRDFNYDDTQILPKQQEEALLYQDMRSDAVQQVLRRLNHAHPPL